MILQALRHGIKKMREDANDLAAMTWLWSKKP